MMLTDAAEIIHKTFIEGKPDREKSVAQEREKLAHREERWKSRRGRIARLRAC